MVLVRATDIRRDGFLQSEVDCGSAEVECFAAGCGYLTKLILTAPNLERLNLSHCHRLEHFSVHGRKLRNLNLQQCRCLNHRDSVTQVVNLRRLNLSGCRELTSAGPFLVAAYHGMKFRLFSRVLYTLSCLSEKNLRRVVSGCCVVRWDGVRTGGVNA